MSGTEKDGVPEGSFELDPACLPANSDDICYPSVTDSDVKFTSAEVDCSIPDSSKPRISVSENPPKKPANLMRENGIGAERRKPRRSPRGLNFVDENGDSNAYDSSTGMETSGHINGKESFSEYSTSKADFLTCQASKQIDIEIEELCQSKGNSIQHSSSSGCIVSENELHDFKGDRYEGKFEPNQVWALYVPEHNLPKMYGQIKRIEQPLSGCMLHRLYLSHRVIVADSMFVEYLKRTRENPELLGSLPSHINCMQNSIARSVLKFTLKAGEVWALYKNWNDGLTSPELKNYECELVEIVSTSDGLRKVAPLVPFTLRK